MADLINQRHVGVGSGISGIVDFVVTIATVSGIEPGDVLPWHAN